MCGITCGVGYLVYYIGMGVVAALAFLAKVLISLKNKVAKKAEEYGSCKLKK